MKYLNYIMFGVAGICFLCVYLSMTASTQNNQAAGAEVGVAVGKPAPAFSLTDQDGKTVNLSDFAGKIIVLEWVNPACPIVQRHYKAGTMIDLYTQYKDKGIVWLSINSTSTDTNDADKKWATDQKVPWPVLSDASGATGHAYGATNTPGMFVVGADGTVKYKGAIDNDPQGAHAATDRVNYVKQALDEILAGKPVSAPETKQYGCTVKYAS
jgi:peroxiredoxin